MSATPPAERPPRMAAPKVDVSHATARALRCAPCSAAAMPVDLKLDDLKSELCAARDELDKWVEKESSSLQSRKVKHEDDIVRSNGAPPCQ